MLAAYEIEGDHSMAEGGDAEWADKQWKYLEEHLAIDATQLCIGDQGQVVDDDTLPHTQGEPATSTAAHTMVQRAPGLPWERATASEEEEFAAHEADERLEKELQRARDEDAWNRLQEQKGAEDKARASQQWDDWALRSEMARPIRWRPVKRFKLEVSVTDRDGSELATATLQGETEQDDSPQVTFGLHTEIANGMTETEEQHVDGMAEETCAQEHGQDKVKGEGSEAETEPVGMIPPPVTSDLENLDDILTSTMCREWFQWWSDGKVDNGMVESKFGKRVLETFLINRAMIEMDEASQVDKELLPDRSCEELGGQAAAGVGASDSSTSGGDSNAGFSDAKLGAHRGLAAGSMEEDGEGVGWPGPAGDGVVRRWYFPNRDRGAKAALAEEASDTRVRMASTEINEENLASGSGTTAATADVVGFADMPPQDVLTDTQMDALLGADMDVNEDGEGEGRPDASTTEGAAEGSSSSDRGRGRQLDLSHWLL